MMPAVHGHCHAPEHRAGCTSLRACPDHGSSVRKFCLAAVRAFGKSNVLGVRRWTPDDLVCAVLRAAGRAAQAARGRVRRALRRVDHHRAPVRGLRGAPELPEEVML